jgi:SNF2 family DNA or RNA helicase
LQTSLFACASLPSSCLTLCCSYHPAVPQIEQQPAYIYGTQLQRHQLSALQWLRSMWVAKRPALLADEQGLGKTASCVAYIASLLAEFKVTAPVLVVAPLSMLGFWEGEREGWV